MEIFDKMSKKDRESLPYSAREYIYRNDGQYFISTLYINDEERKGTGCSGSKIKIVKNYFAENPTEKNEAEFRKYMIYVERTANPKLLEQVLDHENPQKIDDYRLVFAFDVSKKPEYAKALQKAKELGMTDLDGEEIEL